MSCLGTATSSMLNTKESDSSELHSMQRFSSLPYSSCAEDKAYSVKADLTGGMEQPQMKKHVNIMQHVYRLSKLLVSHMAP